jgi:hypothetical protein
MLHTPATTVEPAALNRRNRGVQHLQLRRNSSHSVVVQLGVVRPNLIRLGAELPLVAHVGFREQDAQLPRQLLQEMAVEEN